MKKNIKRKSTSAAAMFDFEITGNKSGISQTFTAFGRTIAEAEEYLRTFLFPMPEFDRDFQIKPVSRG